MTTPWIQWCHLVFDPNGNIVCRCPSHPERIHWYGPKMEWYRSSKMKLHLEIQYSLLEKKIIICLRNLPGLRDLVRQKLVMGVKTNMPLQWIIAAKNPQIRYVTGRVKLGMKGQTDLRQMQGKCTVLWMLRCESQREKGESQMTPGFWTGRQAAVYQIEAGCFWLRRM